MKLMRALKKEHKKMRTVRSYWNEYSLLDDMSKCSSRYLLSVDIENLTDEQYVKRESYARKIREYCSIKKRYIEKECLKNTGKSLFSCLKTKMYAEKENKGIYVGMTKNVSNDKLIIDRKKLKIPELPNGFILGSPLKGKSIFINTKDVRK